MISEAAATVKRVHVIDLDGGAGECDRFHEAMRAVGTTRPFSDRIESSSYWVLDYTARASAAPRGLGLGRRTQA
jgi:mitochondrial fission protein ELM1